MGIKNKLRIIQLTLDVINRKVDLLMATQAELAAQITSLKDQVVKIGTETSKSLQMITDLQAQVAGGGTVTPELQKAVDDLMAQLKLVDDMVPDNPTPTPTPS